MAYHQLPTQIINKIRAVILFAGVQLLLLGIVGQYIGQIYVSQQKGFYQ